MNDSGYTWYAAIKAEVCHPSRKAMGTEPGTNKRKHLIIDTIMLKK